MESMTNYGLSYLSDSLTPEQIDAVNLYQLHLSDGMHGGLFTCRVRHDSVHGSEGGDMGLLLANRDGLACPYCDFRQSLVPSCMVRLADPQQAPISLSEIDYYLARASRLKDEYAALALNQLATMTFSAGSPALIQTLLDSIDGRIAQLQARKESASGPSSLATDSGCC